MNGFLRLDYFDRFKRDMFAVQAFEQACAAAEQHGNEVDRDFINETKFEELLSNVCARYVNILTTCQFFRCFKRGFNAINETVYTIIRYVLWDTV